MKLFYIIQKVHWAIYALGYFVKVFVEWRFSNPFQWVVDLPTMTNEDRGIGLTLVFVYLVCIGVISKCILDFKTTKHETKCH